MAKRRIVLLPLVASMLTLAAACTPRTTVRHPLVPATGITGDEEYQIQRGYYDALEVGAGGRLERRARLEAWLLGEADRDLAAQRPERALTRFRLALTLWDAEELWAKTDDDGQPGSCIDDAPLLRTADSLDQVFRRRGGHQAVLLALAVERALCRGDSTAPHRWRQLLDWTRLEDTLQRGSRKTMEDLEEVVEVWPTPLVVEELARVYLDQVAQGSRVGGSGLGEQLSEMLNLGAQPAMVVRRLAALYLGISQPQRAATALGRATAAAPELEGSPLAVLLAKTLRPEAGVRDALALAVVFARLEDDLPVAERICRDAGRRFAKESAPWLCVGEIAARRGRMTVAIDALERAVDRDATDWTAWMALARLYHNRLVQLASNDKLGDLGGELRHIETLHAEAQRRFPGKELEPSIADALYAVGRGYFNAGKIDEALRFLDRSLDRAANLPALEQLAQIQLKRGRGRAAMAVLDRAWPLAEKEEPDAARLYWQAKLERHRGDAWELLGDHPQALAAWRHAADNWHRIIRLHARTTGEGRAEAELERGKLLYLLGDRVSAIRSFERAIDTLPERGITYAETLAFLIPRGEREEALDAYHRALGRPEITEYLKTYFTLWVINLDRRVGQPEDPLGHAFLADLSGHEWYHQLAAWATGRMDDAELLARADSPAKRSEAYFYQAMRVLERGDQAEAEKLWRQVLVTEMMSYFEFDMATYYLTHGAKLAPPAASPNLVLPPGGDAI